MTIQELRQHKEYALCMEKIKKYSKGFQFTIPYHRMTKGQSNAMKIIMCDAIEEGLVQSVAIGLSLNGDQTEETFIKV